MKMHSIRYLIKEGILNTWANRLMSLASIGVLVACMVVIGLAILISENVTLAMGRLEQQNVVMVYMKDYSWALYGEDDDKDNTSSTTTSSNTSSTSSETDTTSSDTDKTSSETNSDENDNQTDATSSETDKEEIKGEEPDKNGIKSSDYVIHDAKEAKEFCKLLEKIPNVKSAVYVPKEEALEQIKKDMLEGQEQYFTFLDEDYGNPLSDAAKVTMEDMSKFDETLKEIKKHKAVSKIQSYDDLADTITAVKNGIGIAGVCIISILVIISLVIVSNTIRVTMYNRKLEISIMKAVGATDSFVRIPFIAEGMLIGLVSALISEGLLYFCYRIASEAIASALDTNTLVAYGDVAWYLLLVFIGIGIFAGALGSIIIIGKYLRKEGSEFAAI